MSSYDITLKVPWFFMCVFLGDLVGCVFLGLFLVCLHVSGGFRLGFCLVVLVFGLFLVFFTHVFKYNNIS